VTDPHTWKKSSFSGLTDCVEVAEDRQRVLVRDSKRPAGTVLGFTEAEWRVFLAAVKAGEFDL
jgi:hypothetical protein